MKHCGFLVCFLALISFSIEVLAEPVDLDLSQDQKAILSKIREQYRGEIQAKRKMIRSKQEVLKKALESQVDEKQLLSLFEALQAEKKELERVRFEELLKMRAELSLEQRQLLRNFQKSRGFTRP